MLLSDSQLNYNYFVDSITIERNRMDKLVNGIRNLGTNV